MEYQRNIFKDKNEKHIRKFTNNTSAKLIPTDLKPGQILEGTVTNIKKYGAFIKLQTGGTGLMHIEDMSVSRIKTPNERFSIGQNIKVMVKSINEGKVVLTYKELLGTWEENIKDIEVGMKVQGIVKEPDKFKNGVFIELKPNLVGMAEYSENLKYGDKVDVFIKRIIPEKKKIKLVIM